MKYNVLKALNQLREDLYTWAFTQFSLVKECFLYINTFLMIEDKTEQDAQALIDEVFGINTNE